MRKSPIGVAVIGAGMAGRSHAYAYRAATTVFDDRLPAVRLSSETAVDFAYAYRDEPPRRSAWPVLRNRDLG